MDKPNNMPRPGRRLRRGRIIGHRTEMANGGGTRISQGKDSQQIGG